uniref:Uma2 family endonuclease n=1 Tax=Desulforadius tongensis TaxID=1216062 RepID=UPI00308451AC
MIKLLPKLTKVTYEEFLEMDNSSEDRLEYINGEVHLQSAPSVEHQRVVTNLSTEFGIYFKNKECKHFVAPFDVVFQNETEKHRVQPDITVICDKSGFNENNYTGVPTIAVEVLSPSTTSKDYVIKMDLYMRFGVKEYWIVSPKNKSVEIFTLENGIYLEPVVYSKDDTVKSSIFTDLSIQLKDIFINGE